MIWKTVLIVIFAVGALGNNVIEFMEYCSKNGAEDQIEAFENTISTFGNCLTRFIDFQLLQREVNQALPHGTIKTVVKKYCDMSKKLKNCVYGLNAGVGPCLDPSMTSKAWDKASDNAIDFICKENGKKLASFFDEGGMQCVKEKVTLAGKCVEGWIYNPPDASKLITFLENSCPRFGDLQDCMMKTLKDCPTMAAANLAEALFVYFSKPNACKVRWSLRKNYEDPNIVPLKLYYLDMFKYLTDSK